MGEDQKKNGEISVRGVCPNLSVPRNSLARELVLVAPALASVRLVRSVQTVRQPVAETSLQYALAVTARELVFQGTS